MSSAESTTEFCRLVGAVIALVVAAAASPAYGFEFEFEEVRNYRIPQGFGAGEDLVVSSFEGRTLVAATVGEGGDSTCTVVVASTEFARAFPYRHSPEGTRCSGVTLHPGGGFVVRGAEAGAEEGEVAGFTARVDGAGRERWVLSDGEIAEDPDFRGSYRRPDPVLAYSRRRERLLALTVGLLDLGPLGQKEIPTASVIAEGDFRDPAQRLGSNEESGTVRGVETLEESGDFLVFLERPTTGGARFLTFDGRQTVDEFEPLGEDWSERYARDLDRGPDGAVYVLWTEDDEEGQPTQLAAVDSRGREVWSREYSTSARVAGESVELGSPRRFWVGEEYLLVLYPSEPAFVRAVDRETGRARGVAQLSGATQFRAIEFVRGPDGRLRLLAVDVDVGRFRELLVKFDRGSGAPDAGLPDGGFADGGGPPGGGSGNGDVGGGCSSTAPPDGTPPAVPWWAALWAVASGLRGGGRR